MRATTLDSGRPGREAGQDGRRSRVRPPRPRASPAAARDGGRFQELQRGPADGAFPFSARCTRTPQEGGYGGSRDGYRKEGSAPGDYNPEFRGSGGFGRGAGMQR